MAVDVSWLAFDTAATPVDVTVSWLAFDTSATPCDVRVSWLCLDTASETSFSNEVDLKKRWYIRRGKRLHVFDTAKQADDYIDSEAIAAQAIEQAQRTSRRARKRLRERIQHAHQIAHQTVEIDWLADLMARYAMQVNLVQLLDLGDFEKVMKLRDMVLAMRDEEDIEFLLLVA